MRLLENPRYIAAIQNTMILASVVTIFCTVIGVPLAYVTARYSFPGKWLIALLPLITLVLPEVIAAQTWLMMLGNNGLVTRFLKGYGIILPSFYGWFGLIVSMSFIYYTYIYIGVVAAIGKFDVQLEEAAQSLGTSPAKSRLRVMLPVIMPTVLASALLVFTMVVGNFAISMILSHRLPLLSVVTYQAAVAEGASDITMQSTLASVSVLIVMLVLFCNRFVISRGRFEIVQGRGAKPVPLRGLNGLLVAISAGFIVIVSLLPLCVIVVGAFTASRGPVMQWGNWTFSNIARVFVTAPQPLVNSLTYAATATFISIIFSAVVSYLVVKKPNLITPIIDYISAIPLALSGTVLGVGLLATFHGGWLPLSGTAMIIVLAYVVRRMPFGMRNSQAILQNIPNSIEEASISLGVPPVRSFLKVVLPMMLPAIASAAILTWTTTVAELSASILVYSGGRETLPIQVFRLLDSGLMAYASAYGLVLVTVILVPIIIATKLFRIDVFASK
ncbi:binding-protein-dependent transport system inner membrane component family protein [Brucella thiophenivorans]|uniref:Binding-protein-dependent transport system inner membrane component family protein n=2 Tax=Brucella thiophenivorans TaxID=571255 RepID=A0A256FJ29_9HYPH|nr:binding-protein-dependent transport system inner membrane component family protein [Brucella thiophenivorans]